MLSETFLDLILELYLSKKIHSNLKSMIIKNDLIMIFDYINNHKLIPEKLKPKFDLVKYFVEQFDLDSSAPDLFIDELIKNPYYQQFESVLKFYMTKTIDSNRINIILNQIEFKKESIHIQQDKEKIEIFLDKYDTNNFKSTGEMIKEFENIISQIYVRTLLKKKYSDITEEVNEFSFENLQDVEKAFEIINKRNDTGSKIITGFHTLDNNVLRKGFEQGRIYIFGGTPGVGKSLFLARFMSGALLQKANREGLYFYFTLENFMDETLDRISKIMAGMIDDRYNVRDPNEIKTLFGRNIQNILSDNKIFDLKYFQSYQSNINDLMIHIEEKILETGKQPAMIVVDYLDLLTSVRKTDMYRLELGFITMELKLLAIKYNCPVLTATQLNSSGYSSNGIPELQAITESKKKVEHADFVAFISKGQNVSVMNDSNKRVIISVKKNRNGPLKDLQYNVDYERFVVHDNGYGELNISKVNNMFNNNYNNTNNNFNDSARYEFMENENEMVNNPLNGNVF